MDSRDVSFAQQPTVNCPRCEQPCEPDVWLVVDGDARPELLARLREGSLRALACPRCGEALGEADAPLLLLQRRADPPLLFTPARQTTEEEDREQAAGLVGMVRERLGGAWREEWLAQGLAVSSPHQVLPPFERAVLAFASAPDEATARALFEAQREFLMSYEAVQVIDELLARMEDEAGRGHLALRRAWLMQWRGEETPAPPPTVALARPEAERVEPPAERGASFQYSAYATQGGVATVTNYIVEGEVELKAGWLVPEPPVAEDVIPRAEKVRDVEALLGQGGTVAVTSSRVSLHGLGGIGKTILAQLVGAALRPRFPAGVLWEVIGEGYDETQCNSALNRWGSLGFGGWLKEGQQYTAHEVRAILARAVAEVGPLLLVLDDVWKLEAIQPLLAARPPGVTLLVTTRSRHVAGEVGTPYELDLLTEQEALDLARLRFAAKGAALNEPQEAELLALAEAVEFHTMAFDIALSSLLRRRTPLSHLPRILEELRTGQGFGELPLDPAQRDGRVERSLARSYWELSEGYQQRFRWLGGFAPGAAFSSAQAAALWECPPHEAEDTLALFEEAALLRGETAEGAGTLWNQHALLRLYAWALLRQGREAESAAARHAALFTELMRKADAAQWQHTMRPFWPQLRHAFGWAVGNDLGLALKLIGWTDNLRAAFFELGTEGFYWVEQVLAAARARADRALLAQALGSYGNVLTRVAAWAGQDRRARLLEALAAYDEVLRFRRPEVAPLNYAGTQNNRALVLLDLATLPGEDRRARLLKALAACDEALHHCRPEVAPIDYARTHNNRANVLLELATLPGEDRPTHLLEALAAYDEALRFRRSEVAPLNYAMTQHNRALLLSQLATLPGEDRRTRLLEALTTYDEALCHLRPEVAPLAYAKTQHNRAALLSQLATLPGEDRPTHLLEALAAYDEALRFRRPEVAPLDYAETQHNRAALLGQLATLPGEDRHARLIAALHAAWEAIRLCRGQHARLFAISQLTFHHIRAACGQEFAALWAELGTGTLPDWMESVAEGAALSEEVQAELNNARREKGIEEA